MSKFSNNWRLTDFHQKPVSPSLTMFYSICESQMATAAQLSELQASGQIELSFLSTTHFFWAASQLILMYCVLGFNPIQNHSG